MNLVLGADHAGFAMRAELARWAREQGHDATEVGATSEEAYDYPDASDEVVKLLLDGTAERGVLICGSGIGVCIRANRHAGIRAAQAFSPEMAAMARQHNDANIVCLASRLLDLETASRILEMFLKTDSSAELRHRRRVEKLDAESR